MSSAKVDGAADADYVLWVALFRHKARWSSATESIVYGAVVMLAGAIDLGITRMLYVMGNPEWLAKSMASLVGLVFNFVGRRYWVFRENGR